MRTGARFTSTPAPRSNGWRADSSKADTWLGFKPDEPLG